VPPYHPVDALDAQLDLIRWYQSTEGVEYLQRHGGDRDQELEDDAFWESRFLGHKGDWFDEGQMDRAGSWLDTAETYAITPDMQALVMAAARTAPEDPLRSSDVPVPKGFLWFGKPGIPLPTDAEPRHAIWPFRQDNRKGGWGTGQMFWVVALAWETVGTGIQYHVYVDPKPFDKFLKDNNRHNPFTGLTQLFDVRTWDYDIEWFFDREDFEDPEGYEAEARHRAALEEYAAVHGLTMAQVVEGACDGAEFFYRRLLLTFFRLTFQRVTVPHREFMGRAAKRRTERSTYAAPEPGTITIIKLRREYQQQHEEHVPGTVDWSHRWMVSGHWRNQWYPSLGRHQAKYIPPYVKGPEDKPFVPKDRIWSVEQ